MNTTNTRLKTLSHLLLILMMICNPISVIFSQQTITSTCESPTRMDAHVIGIHDTGNKIVPLAIGTNRVTMECTCRDKNTGPCPNTVTFSIRKFDGTTQQVVATAVTVNVGNDYTGGYPMKIYRATYNGTAANRLTYNAPPTASRPSMRGLVVWRESVGNNYIPNIPNNYVPNNYIVDRFFFRQPGHSYDISVPPSSVSRDFVIKIPVHEHNNNSNRYIIYEVSGLNGNTELLSVNEPFNDNNDEGEIRLDKITLNNVPTNVNKIRVRIQSPESNGGSYLIGSIMATSTPCCVPVLNCPSNITRATDAGRCDYTVQGGELNPTLSGGCPVTLSNSYNSDETLAGATFPVGTTTITWTAGEATCQTTITVNDNEAPILDCPDDITVTAVAGVCESSAEFAPNVTDNCEATVTCSRLSGDIFSIGTTTVICTATDVAGNTDTCEFDVTVEQCDTCLTTVENITHSDDNDINTGTNDQESFFSNPIYRFFNPGLPTIAILTGVSLELYFRVFGESCEDEIEVRVTDPMGNMTIFKPFATCDGTDLYHVVLDLPDVLLEEGSLDRWEIEFRDTNDQNIGAAEFSPRFARLIYDATVNECDVDGISTSNKNELLSELSEIRLYPVPTSGVLNMVYTSDEDGDLFIEIFDGTGRVVGYQKESAISGVNTFNMQVDDLAQGMYYLRIMDNVGRMQVKPFTKVNP